MNTQKLPGTELINELQQNFMAIATPSEKKTYSKLMKRKHIDSAVVFMHHVVVKKMKF